MSGEPQLFVGDIDPKDIVEGYLGNSYFVSTIRALAENPSNIKRLFDTKKGAKDGEYVINLSLNGENYKIIVDDFIPYCEKTKKPAFTSSKPNEMWVMLLEKAWAKVSGNYENSIRGLCCEAFRALSGAPVEYVKHTYIQDVWNKIHNSYLDGNISCGLAEQEDMPRNRVDEMDLFSAYAYPIIRAYEYNSEEGKVRLLKIRNPAGHKWLGMFTDTSKVWESELKKNMAYKPGDQNDLLISIEDYLCYFRTTLICYCNNKAVATTLRCKHYSGDSSLIRISKTESGSMSFTASQFNQKFVGRSENYQPSFIRMMIARERESSEMDADKFPLQYMDGICGFDEHMTMCLDLKEGEYLAFVEIQGRQLKKSNNFVFRTYGEDTPLMEDISGGSIHKSFLKDALSSCAREKGERKTYHDKGEPNMFRCLSIDETKTKYGYLYYENNSVESILKEEVEFEQLEGVIIMEHSGKRKLHVEVQPGEHKIFVLNQIEKQYLMKCEYYSSIHRSTKDLIDLVKVKGEKKQIKFDGKAHDIYYYVYDDGDGYIWMFDNESKDYIFEGTFFYTLNNLKISDEEAKGGSEWKVCLNPGERSYMRMDAIDITKSWGYKCKCSFHLKDDISTSQKLIKKVKDQGERQQIICHGKPENVFYYICFINDEYIWYFENKTEQKFSATFKFYMDNLKLEGDEDNKPRTQFEIFLEPYETCIKKMVQIDPMQNSKYECSYTCELS